MNRISVPSWATMALCGVLLGLAGCGGGGDAPVTTAAADKTVPTAAVTPTPLAAPTTAADTGPALETDPNKLAGALVCSSNLANANRPPVLLVHGTPYNAKINYSWNWEPALDSLGFPYCTVDLPVMGTGELQNAAEYIVYAIRQMRQVSGRKVQVVGYSMGGMLPRWALKYWPDTRDMVSELVSLSAVNHGTLDAIPVCAIPCAPAIWQLKTGSKFLATLNKDFETLPGINYTSIYTRTDEVAVPNLGGALGTSALNAGPGHKVVNIATQDICPLSVADHITIGSSDPVAYAVAMDALVNQSTASPARVARSACFQLAMPGVDLRYFATNVAVMGATFLIGVPFSPTVRAEPPLKCYAGGTCS